MVPWRRRGKHRKKKNKLNRGIFDILVNREKFPNKPKFDEYFWGMK